MARRPVFKPDPNGRLVEPIDVEFEWHSGFALVQKQRNITALHQAAFQIAGITRPLEISTKSPDPTGQRLSAFNLQIYSRSLDAWIPLESAFQGSKVFRDSGQHPEIYHCSSGREAKRAAQQYETEGLAGFRFEGVEWPLEPTTAFYDWLYLTAAVQWGDRNPALLETLRGHDGFTDIEFNPRRSLNCQARSCALLVSLHSIGDIQAMIGSGPAFVELLRSRGYANPPHQPGLI